MKVLAKLENQHLKGYLVQDNGKEYRADVIFADRKPRSRVVVDIIRKLKEIIQGRKEKINHPVYLKYFAIAQVEEEYCFLRENQEELQPLLLQIIEGNTSLEKRVEWVISLVEVLLEAENKEMGFLPVSLRSLWVNKDCELRLIDPDIIDMVEQYWESKITYPPKEIYYPPEYYQKQLIDEKGRIYSVGVILYYLLTGKAPFTSGDKADLIDEIMNTEPVAPRYLNPQLSTKLNDLILQTIEKDSKKRIKNWSELLKSLKELLQRQEITATAAEKAQSQSRANKILKASERKKGFRNFWRKYWKAIGAGALAVAVFLAMGLMDNTVPVVTTETPPEQVVQLFYEGIDSKNIQYLEETCAVELKYLEKLVMETYVIEKARDAYSIDGKERKIFGITDFNYSLVSEGKEPLYRVNYIFYIYTAEEQKLESNMEDLLKLSKVQGKWQVIDIKGSLEKIIAGQMNELLPREDPILK